MTAKKESLIEYRIKSLEDSYNSLDIKVDKLLTNHIPHLQDSMTSLSGRVEAQKGEGRILASLNVGAIIIGILVSKIFFK